MSNPPDWLPEALRYGDFGGDWEKFFATIYEIFERDFKHSRPYYRGKPLIYDSTIEDGKEVTFWHVTTSIDKSTGERLPAFRRAERISWIRPIIEHSDDKALKVWRNKRGRETRVLLWLEELDFLLILREKPQKAFLLTAYCIDTEHRRATVRKEWQQCSENQNIALRGDVGTPSTRGR